MIETLKEIVTNYVDVNTDEITRDTKLLADLGLTSLDLVMISDEIEKEFNIELPARLYASIKTVGDLLDYLENNANK